MVSVLIIKSFIEIAGKSGELETKA